MFLFDLSDTARSSRLLPLLLLLQPLLAVLVRPMAAHLTVAALPLAFLQGVLPAGVRVPLQLQPHL